MRSMVAQSLVWSACFIAGLIAPADPSVAANCALYARAETGVALFGSAGGWWDEADGRYERGHVPVMGAILVFKRTRRIPSGHVAVVAKVISAHEILVDHANWYRGTVSRGMSVIDTSPDHDWTSVAVIDLPSGKHGRDYPTFGFVYPGRGLQEIVEAHDRRSVDSYVADRQTSLAWSPQPGLLLLADATEDLQGRVRGTTATRGTHHRKEAAMHPIRKAAAARGHHDALVARAKPASRAHASHAMASPAHGPGARAAIARPPTHIVRTTEAKHHRA